ncbi:MAG: lipid-transfer protein [Actinobacteria bacterium]|nr:MAG: lipid-transfer protein [Actinomycetota bacterium]
MPEKVFVVGVGMTKFEKPGSREWDYPDMVKEAGTKALDDAGIAYDEVEQAVAAYCYGDSTSGQEAIYELGLSGIPIVNVNNNCSTGSSALFLARQLIAGGMADCMLAVGFEKMEKGALGLKFMDRRPPMSRHLSQMIEIYPFAPAPPAPQVFGNAGREHMERFGTTPEQFAKIGEKNHRHSVNNPYSQFQGQYTLEQILEAPTVYEPTSDGSGAAVLASERFVGEHNLWDNAVEIAGQAMTTDGERTFSERSCINLAGADMTRRAAQKVYAESGLGPEDVQVIELHDCFSTNELITYEGLGLCPEGAGGKLIDEGAVTYGGQWVVNPSGGLISKGHPLGATGLAQCAELTWQLRGVAGARQVPGVKAALQHNLGLGGAAVVTMYRKAKEAA